jgi:hypothetical protein
MLLATSALVAFAAAAEPTAVDARAELDAQDGVQDLRFGTLCSALPGWPAGAPVDSAALLWTTAAVPLHAHDVHAPARSYGCVRGRLAAVAIALPRARDARRATTHLMAVFGAPESGAPGVATWAGRTVEIRLESGPPRRLVWAARRYLPSQGAAPDAVPSTR